MITLEIREVSGEVKFWGMPNSMSNKTYWLSIPRKDWDDMGKPSEIVVEWRPKGEE